MACKEERKESMTRLIAVLIWMAVPFVRSVGGEDAAATIVSTLHCVGENFNASTVWMDQSCAFTNVCFSAAPTRNEPSIVWYYFPSKHEKKLQQLWMSSTSSHPHQQSLTSISTIAWDPMTGTKQVSLGSIQGNNDDGARQQKPWFPTVVRDAIPAIEQDHDRLPASTVVVPIQFTLPMTEATLWKDLFAVYTLLSLFGHVGDSQQDVLLVPMNAPQPIPHIIRPEWLNVLGATLWEPSSPTDQCASHVVAGVGRFLDDSAGRTHSMFRGIGLYEFGVYARQQLDGLSKRTTTEPTTKSRVYIVVLPGEEDGSALDLSPPPHPVTIESLGDIMAVTAPRTDATEPSLSSIWIVPSHHPFLFPLSTLLPRRSILLVHENEAAPHLSRHDRAFLQSLTHVQVRFVPAKKASSQRLMEELDSILRA